jgi:iron complex outermembrane recepter protein
MPAKGVGGIDFHCRCFINVKMKTMKQVILLLASVCISLQTHAQYSLKGTVTDNEIEPLAGAYVQLKGTYFQTMTDKLGNFVFSGIKKGGYELRVSFIGFETYHESIEVTGDLKINPVLKESALVTDAVIISAVRASRNTPTTYTTIGKEEIARQNLAQDLPYILGFQPSVVTTSDAGGGVGYTGLRIRGSDITRINVTINGIPLNDPESHAVYWVDIPDFASSVNSLQLQRGVGSSTNGAGAFGASMNLETNGVQAQPYGMVSASAGSFGTYKTSFQAGTGLIRNHWYFEGRGSAIGSDGYVDRASSKLSSFYIQGGYSGENTLIKAVAFGGSEKTYQAWYGIDAYTMKIDRTFNWAGVVYNPDGSLWYYNNQTDNYKQNHYQLHISHRLSRAVTLNMSGHYTYGRGYYEEYRQDEPFADYRLQNQYFGRDSIFLNNTVRYFYHDSVTQTDLIRRRWLDNQYYGATWSVRSKHEKTDVILGGAWNKYDNARHYGEIIWAEYAGSGKPGDRYYNNTGFKTDFNLFLKAGWSPVKALTLYGDLQYRQIVYKAGGTESHLEQFAIDESFHFFNPKAGLSYDIKAGTLYASYGIAHREPIRDDYTDAAPGEKPEPETLGDFELGLRKSGSGLNYALNFFLMNYHNQLVLTGQINDDGAYIRKNTGKSYRTGIELSGLYPLNTHFILAGNISILSGKTNYRVENSDGGITEYRHMDLSFSPRMVSAFHCRILPVKNVECDWQLKYVGRQFLDNTENKDLSLDDYTTNDLHFSYLISPKEVGQIEFSLMLNNIFNVQYESNGYVYDNTPYYYPQAGFNFMAGVAVRF